MLKKMKLGGAGPSGPAPSRASLKSVSTAQGMSDSIPNQGMGAPGARSNRIAALKKMRGNR